MVRREIEPGAFLANLPLFKELGAASVARIAEGATKLKLARGATVFRRGDTATGFFVVAFGEVRLVAYGARRSPLAGIVGPGRSFGEPMMFLEKPYLVDAVAHTDALLVHVPKEAVFAEIERNPRFARRVIAGLAARIETLVAEIDRHVRGTAQQRPIAYLLRGRADASGETSVTLPATKAAVASQLGLTPEHFSRILHELAARALLRVDGRRIVITDAARLATHARGQAAI